jgi:hypothetical protein
MGGLTVAFSQSQKAGHWIEHFCLFPNGLERGQCVRLTEAQREILHRVFDTDESPGEIHARRC